VIMRDLSRRERQIMDILCESRVVGFMWPSPGHRSSAGDDDRWPPPRSVYAQLSVRAVPAWLFGGIVNRGS